MESTYIFTISLLYLLLKRVTSRWSGFVSSKYNIELLLSPPKIIIWMWLASRNISCNAWPLPLFLQFKPLRSTSCWCRKMRYNSRRTRSWDGSAGRSEIGEIGKWERSDVLSSHDGWVLVIRTKPKSNQILSTESASSSELISSPNSMSSSKPSSTNVTVSLMRTDSGNSP